MEKFTGYFDDNMPSLYDQISHCENAWIDLEGCCIVANIPVEEELEVCGMKVYSSVLVPRGLAYVFNLAEYDALQKTLQAVIRNQRAFPCPPPNQLFHPDMGIFKLELPSD